MIPDRDPDPSATASNTGPGDTAEQELLAGAEAELRQAALGMRPREAEALLREFAREHAPYVQEPDLVLLSRRLADPAYGRKRPVQSLLIAWRLRQERPMRATWRQLRQRSTGFVG